MAKKVTLYRFESFGMLPVPRFRKTVPNPGQDVLKTGSTCERGQRRDQIIMHTAGSPMRM